MDAIRRIEENRRLLKKHRLNRKDRLAMYAGNIFKEQRGGENIRQLPAGELEKAKQEIRETMRKAYRREVVVATILTVVIMAALVAFVMLIYKN
jgi:uncharacterized protein YecA (UPF0149 family)